MSFAQDLRASVLQAAMQGELTEQLETDTPVSELLADIKAEKDRLISEKKIKKEKSLAPISEDEIPFDIPENWEYVKLGDMSFITSGGTPSRSNPSFWNGGIPWVKIGDMSSKYLDKTEETISQKGLENSSAKYFEKGTILYSIFASIGTVSILNIKATTNQAIAGIVPYGNIDTDYLYYVLVALKDILVKKGRGCAQSNINQEILKNTPIPIPPIEEQKRIVRRIKEIMIRINELEAIEEELKKLKEVFPADMKAAVLQAAMQGKLAEQLPTDGEVDVLIGDVLKERKSAGKFPTIEPLKIEDCDIPAHWGALRAGQCLGLLDGKKVDNVNLPYLEARYLRGLKSAEYKTSGKFVQSGENVILVDGENSGEAFTLKEDGILGSTFKVLFIPKSMNKKFLLYFLEQHRDLLRNNKRGAAIPHLNKELFNNLVLPIPPLEEQQRIVEKLDKLLPLCDKI